MNVAPSRLETLRESTVNRLDRFNLNAEYASGPVSSESVDGLADVRDALAGPGGTSGAMGFSTDAPAGRAMVSESLGMDGVALRDSGHGSARQDANDGPQLDAFFSVAAPAGHLDRARALELLERIGPVAQAAASTGAGRPAVVDLAAVESIAMDVVVLLAGFQCLLQRQGQSFVVIHARPEVGRFFKASLRQSPMGAQPADSKRAGDPLARARTEYGWLGAVQDGADMPTRAWGSLRSRARAVGLGMQRGLSIVGIHVGFR